MILNLLRTLHAWTGAILALILIVTGLTGSLLVFKGDFIRATVPAARDHVAATPQVLGLAADKVEHVLHGELRYLVFAGPRLGVHQATFTAERYAYVDKDGEIVATWRGPGRPESFVYELHHFLLAGDKGMRVVGVAGLIAVALAVSGLVVWLPGWRGFSFLLWPKSAKRGHLIHAHRNIGALFALPIVVFCLTGAGMIFFQTTGVLLAKLMPGPAAEEFFPPNDPGDVDWVKALTAAQARFPKATLRAALWPEGPWAPAIVRMKQPGEWTPDGRTEVLIDPSTSMINGVIDPMKLGRGLRLNNALYPIHVAAVGGRLMDVVTFLSGLALAGLGVFGLWSFLIKPRRKAKP